MNDLELISKKSLVAHAERIPVALATVIRLHGSSYRRPGAKMLITRTGEIAGGVSGGCLERDLIMRAVQLMDSGRQESVLVTYDTRADTDDDEAEARVRSVGLGCEGVIEILLNPAPEPHLQAIEHCLASRSVTSFKVTLPNGESYIDVLVPPQRLILFGAGPDAVALFRLARELGWSVTVVNCHSAFPMPRHAFIGSDQYITTDCTTAVSKAVLQKDSVAITMTHNFEHDLAILSSIAQSGWPQYLGLLGPRVRSEKLLNEMISKGLKIPAHGIFYPLGLDIGGDSAQAIALSALADIHAVL
ncbi:MAG: XdhC family protein, partial [Proteobacteria bacterium]